MKCINIVALCAISASSYAQTAIWSNKANSQTRAAYAVAFSADGSKILSGSECHDARVRLWNAQTGALDWDYLVSNNTMCLMGASFGGGNSHFAVMEEMGRLLVFDHNNPSPNLLYNLDMGSNGSLNVDFSADNSKIAIDGYDNSVRIINVADGSSVQRLTGHTGSVYALDWSPNGNFIVSGSLDNTVRVWNGANYQLLHNFGDLGADVKHVKVSADNSIIVVALANNQIRWYNSSTYSLIDSLVSAELATYVDVSDDNQHIAAACNTGVRLFSTQDKSQVAQFNRPNGGRVWSVDFSPSKQLVTGNANGDVTVWELSSLLLSAQSQPTEKSPTIYPNPAQDRLFVQNQLAGSEIRIFSSTGQLVWFGGYSSQGIELNGFYNGVYFVQINRGQPQPFIISR